MYVSDPPSDRQFLMATTPRPFFAFSPLFRRVLTTTRKKQRKHKYRVVYPFALFYANRHLHFTPLFTLIHPHLTTPQTHPSGSRSFNVSIVVSAFLSIENAIRSFPSVPLYYVSRRILPGERSGVRKRYTNPEAAWNGISQQAPPLSEVLCAAFQLLFHRGAVLPLQTVLPLQSQA